MPLSGVRDNPEHLAILEQWLKSYRPEELFDSAGIPAPLVDAANPVGDLRMSATPHANGGLLTRDLDLPDFRELRRNADPTRARRWSRPVGWAR